MASRRFLITSKRKWVYIKSINPIEEFTTLFSADGMTSHRESEGLPPLPQPPAKNKKNKKRGSWYVDACLSTPTESK